LQPNDRIVFGTGSVFLFRHQDLDSKVDLVDSAENPITYEFAMKEKHEIENKADSARKEEERKQIEAETAAKLAEFQKKNDLEK